MDDTVGEIVRASQECPGVYYIAARKQDGKFLADEYYVVEKSSPAISKEAMAYLKQGEGRNTLVCLTEKGRDFSAQKVRPLFQIENKIWSEWTVDEQERYLLFTQKYRDSFKKYLHEDL